MCFPSLGAEGLALAPAHSYDDGEAPTIQGNAFYEFLNNVEWKELYGAQVKSCKLNVLTDPKNPVKAAYSACVMAMESTSFWYRL